MRTANHLMRNLTLLVSVCLVAALTLEVRGESIGRRVYTVPVQIDTQLAREKDLKAFFGGHGVDFPEGSSIEYTRHNRQLTILNTLENINHLDGVLRSLQDQTAAPKRVGKQDKDICRTTLLVPEDARIYVKMNPERYLKSRGVKFPKGASVQYDASQGTVLISNTVANLELAMEVLSDK